MNDLTPQQQILPTQALGGDLSAPVLDSQYITHLTQIQIIIEDTVYYTGDAYIQCWLEIGTVLFLPSGQEVIFILILKHSFDMMTGIGIIRIRYL